MIVIGRRKFDNMESVLQTVNSRYLQLSQDKIAKNRTILEDVLSTFKSQMRNQDPLFNEIFYDVFYAGSFFDDLKVGKPDEFDLDLLMDIGKVADVSLDLSNIPGFMHLRLIKPKDRNSPQISRQIMGFCEGDYFDTSRIVSWMESIIQRILNSDTMTIRTSEGTYRIKFSKSGPAITLHLFTLNGENYYHYEDEEDANYDRTKVMSIDLVPSFTFKGWPQNGFIDNPFSNLRNDPFLSTFFIVPKAPKHSSLTHLTRYWRLSFQAQERKLMENKNRLKSTIRLLKKLRNKYHDDKIASYFIKTALFHIMSRKGDSFWDKPLQEVFMEVLREYAQYIRTKSIPYYWYPRYNLISNVSDVTLVNISNRLNEMIRRIEMQPGRPELVAEFLLKPATFQRFMIDGPIQ